MTGGDQQRERASGWRSRDILRAVAIVAGVGNGVLVGRLGLNPIVATLGMNALLYAGVLGIFFSIVLLNLFAFGIGWVFTLVALIVRTPSSVMT